MLMALRQPEALRVVGDQRGAPTDAAYIADVTALAVARYLHGQGDYPFGLYHVSASGDASWHEYACFIARQARRAGLALTLTPADIRAVPASEYPNAAQRPANAMLDCGRLAQAFGERAALA